MSFCFAEEAIFEFLLSSLAPGCLAVDLDAGSGYTSSLLNLFAKRILTAAVV